MDIAGHDDQILVVDAKHIIDAMNEATEVEGTPDERAAFLLWSLARLLARSSLCTLMLLGDLRRDPAPIVLNRFVSSRDPAQQPLVPDEDLQQELDRHFYLMTGLILPRILNETRTPFTFIGSEAFRDDTWYTGIFAPMLTEGGYKDTMCSAWAASPDRAIMLGIMQPPQDPPFTEADRILMSLMVRAAAPFVDREIFPPETHPAIVDLTGRQREVLLHLLHGGSEKEIAGRLHRSVHTIHTYVKQLYAHFKVSSRGELMATFVDQTIMRAALA